ncbi:MAG TPA: glucose-1-phosphate cytidylyltransferase [Blastocatellia bacterium]|nr:glucose-1-phosphate cytidylyltransferase [Blastocatellia bacterium]
MKVVILAGGLGTRLAEETEVRPKPMIEIGGRPILWHIMKHYSCFGFKEFFIALGYKGEMIKHYFIDYYSLNCNLSIDLSNGQVNPVKRESEDWIVHLMDTGQNVNTGGRVRNLKPWLKDSTFMVTYGDGVSNINLQELLKFHKSHGKIGTVSAVRPPARFGGLLFDGDMVTKFTEKPQSGEGWINGGYLVFEPGIFDYLDGDESSLEAHALERLAVDKQLFAYRHPDFWQCMDTLRDKKYLEGLWDENRAPWKVWE